MVPRRSRSVLRHVALVGLLAVMPLLYIAAVTLESSGWSAAALAVTGVVAAIAVLAY